MLHSQLFNIEPVGIDTAYVESLPSYIKRLAEAHSLLPGDLLKNEILPEVSKYWNWNTALNSCTKTPLSMHFINEAISLLEFKTSNLNIKNTSLTILDGTIMDRMVFRKYAAWCPICYEESKHFNGTIYEPLIWSFEYVTTCLKHKVNLHFTCPNCNHHLSRYDSKARVGYCYICNAWLGADKADKMNDLNIMTNIQMCKVLSEISQYYLFFDYQKILSLIHKLDLAYVIEELATKKALPA